MPLLVVLLLPSFSDELKDASSEGRVRVSVRHRNVSDLFPRLIRDSRDDLKDFELRQSSLARVEEVHRKK